ARRAQRALRAHAHGDLRRAARGDRAAAVRRVQLPPVGDGDVEAPGDRERPTPGGRVRAVVAGGGLAGLAAALDLADAGADVTLLEARPTLGGAVQTLPRRDGDPEPPPDNGQHIALGCFSAYL